MDAATIIAAAIAGGTTTILFIYSQLQKRLNSFQEMITALQMSTLRIETKQSLLEKQRKQRDD